MLAAALIGLFAIVDVDAASTGAMPPVGAVPLSAPANSDTVISLPLFRPAAYSGVVAQVTDDVLTVEDSAEWAVDQFVRNSPSQPDTYFIQLKSGAAAGHFYTVTANTSASLTVDWNSEEPVVSAGDRFDLMPYWTLGTAFPAGDAGKSFIASTSALLRKTELLFIDPAHVGINPPPSVTFYFLNNAWRKVGSPATTSFDDTMIFPDSYLIERNKADSTRLTTAGAVVTGPLAVLLLSQAGSVKQDNPIALRFAGTVTLAQSNLVESGAFQPSTSALLRKDEVLVFDNMATGINKAPAATYYYLNGAWRKVGSAASLDFGSTPVFTPGAGVVIRKAGTGATGRNFFWLYSVTEE